MKKETLYLDTSVPSAYYDERAKERQAATIKFWKEVLPRFHAHISETTLEELENTKDDTLKAKFRKLIRGLRILKIDRRTRALARAYVERGVFSERYIYDATHVAVASCYGISYVVSWNFEHLVKVKTRKLVNSVNVLEGFGEIEIVSPQQL